MDVNRFWVRSCDRVIGFERLCLCRVGMAFSMPFYAGEPPLPAADSHRNA